MRLLIIGSLGGYMTEAAHIVCNRGVQVSHVEKPAEALAFMRAGGADVIFMDVVLNISDLIRDLLAERISIPVIACGLGNETELAVKAIQAGAKEYIPLPPDADLIAAVLESICVQNYHLIYKSQNMTRIVALAEQISLSDASVLITGESGTGKEIIAKFIHEKSRRSRAPFISLNCAAIPENLLESELFGHEKGAFTGALARRIGKFEEAEGGTLLLDEITEMHPRLQAKLLRAIQEREIDRVGGRKPVKVNIRLLATSNRNMEAAVREGVFREDLYFRLNVVGIRLPPLRERKDDIPILAAHFVEKYAKLNDIPVRELTQEALDFLKQLQWLGNVRELENAMHRTVLLSQGAVITLHDISLYHSLDAHASQGNDAATGKAEVTQLIGKTVAEVERELIINTLTHCDGNRTHAATILGISIRTLRNKLRQYREDGTLGSPGNLEEAC